MDKARLIYAVVEVLKERGQVIVPVYGLSMFPFILPGKCVLLMQSITLVKGDVVAYELGNKIVLHRIVRFVNREQVVCKGDSLIREDAPIRTSDILGKVVAIGGCGEKLTDLSPLRRKLGVWYANWSWLFCFFIFPLSFVWFFFRKRIG